MFSEFDNAVADNALEREMMKLVQQFSKDAPKQKIKVSMATGDDEINWEDNFSSYQINQPNNEEDESSLDAPMRALLIRKESDDEDGKMFKAYQEYIRDKEEQAMENNSQESEEPSPRVQLPEEDEEIPIDPVRFKEEFKQKRNNYLQGIKDSSQQQEELDKNNIPHNLNPAKDEPYTSEMYNKHFKALINPEGITQATEDSESEEQTEEVLNNYEGNDENQANNNNQDEDEDEYDDNNCEEETQAEQEEDCALTEVKREFIRKNKWNCQEYRVTYSNGDVFEGETDPKTSLKDGWGAYFYSNGEKYEGFFQDDIIHGYGRYWFLGGHKYEGDWKDGMKHGIGQLEFSTGDKYSGFFSLDNFNGQGEYFYSNGDRFEGTFKEGKKHGPGKFFGAKGRKIIGEWLDDQLQHF